MARLIFLFLLVTLILAPAPAETAPDEVSEPTPTEAGKKETSEYLDESGYPTGAFQSLAYDAKGFRKNFESRRARLRASILDHLYLIRTNLDVWLLPWKGQSFAGRWVSERWANVSPAPLKQSLQLGLEKINSKALALQETLTRSTKSNEENTSKATSADETLTVETESILTPAAH